MAKRILAYLLILAAVLTIFYVGVRWGMKQKGEYENNKFTVEYLNEGESPITLRYKYILSFASADSMVAPEYLENQDSLFHLTKNGLPVVEKRYSEKDNPAIPEVSEAITLKPGEKIESNFVVEVNPKLKSSDEKNIRLETKVFVEELKGKRWTPVYQVILMKRDTYWSLDKGPVEYLQG